MTPETYNADYNPESLERRRIQELLENINDHALLIGRAVDGLEEKKVLNRIMLSSVFATLGEAMKFCEKAVVENQDNEEIKAKHAYRMLNRNNDLERSIRLDTAVTKESMQKNYNSAKDLLGIKEKELIAA